MDTAALRRHVRPQRADPGAPSSRSRGPKTLSHTPLRRAVRIRSSLSTVFPQFPLCLADDVSTVFGQRFHGVSHLFDPVFACREWGLTHCSLRDGNCLVGVLKKEVPLPCRPRHCHWKLRVPKVRILPSRGMMVCSSVWEGDLDSELGGWKPLCVPLEAGSKSLV